MTIDIDRSLRLDLNHIFLFSLLSPCLLEVSSRSRLQSILRNSQVLLPVESGEVEERRKLVIKFVQAFITHCSQSLFSQNHFLSLPKTQEANP